MARGVLTGRDMLHDVTVAFRSLLKRPAYSAAVVMTLALGIGATTLMFSLLDAAVLRPLPFADPARLVFLTGVAGPERSPRGGSFPEISDWRAMNRTMEDVAIYDETSLNLRIGDEALRVETEMVSASYFPVLRAAAALGRTFLPEEDAVPDRSAVAVISSGLWQRRFGGSTDVLQRTIHLNDRPFTIVGVMPEGFAGLSFDTDVWVPSMMVSLTSAPSVVNARGTRWLLAVGRLRGDASVVRAQEDMDRVAAALERQHPEFNRARGVQVTAAKELLLGNTGPLLKALFAAVVLFLTIACANVAGLQLARAAGRRRELAVRFALGAGRRHVLRQLLTESLVLALAGGAIGTLAASWALGGVVALTPDGTLPRFARPAVDPRAIAFAAGVAVLAGALVAMLPAFTARRRGIADALKDGVRSAGPGLGSIRRPSTQQLLVTVEIALAMTLLTAAGLMGTSLQRQLRVTTGFEAGPVTVARLSLPGTRYDPPARAAFVERLVERLREEPGIAAASVGTSLPFTGNSSASILLPDVATGPEGARRYYRNFVTPEFFATLQIPVMRGRAFTAQDRAGAPAVALINESAARSIWKDVDAVGRRLRLGSPDGPAVEIVGIVADARFRDLTTDLSAPRVEPDVYFPYGQRTDRDIEVAVRAAEGSAVPIAVLQSAVSSIDPGLPLYRVQRLEDALRQQTSAARFGSALWAIFSAGALLLAAGGLYGLVAYVVGLSRREIAIRLALGADARRVTALIVRNGLTLAATGIVLGAAGAAVAGRALEAQLFQTGAVEPSAVSAVAVLLLLVAAAACIIATRGAVAVDPQQALRLE